MKYSTPNLTDYISFVEKYRYIIFTVFFGLFVLASTHLKTNSFIDNDYFWIQSDVAKKLQTDSNQKYIAKMEISFKSLVGQDLERKVYLLEQLKHYNPDIIIHSIFNENFWTQQSEEESGMLYSFNIKNYDKEEFLTFIQENHDKYKHFIDLDNQKMYFFLLSNTAFDFKNIDLNNINIEYLKTDIDLVNQLFILLTLIIFIYVLFSIFFKQQLAGVLSVGFVLLTTVFSISIIQNIFMNNSLHIASLYIIISISLLDYIYFFHRWHTYQLELNSNLSLIKSVSRNIKPAFWTSFIVVIGIGPLLFLDSDIIRMIALSALLPSLIGYLLNLTLVPAILLKLKAKNPLIPFGGKMNLFSNYILNINSKFVWFFTVITLVFSVVIGYLFLNGNMINIESKHNVIVYKTDKGDLYDTIEFQIKLNEMLLEHFKTINKIDDLASQVALLIDENHLNYDLTEDTFAEIGFFLELYNLEKKFMDDEHLMHRIYLSDSSEKSMIIQDLESLNSNIHFIDYDSVISNVKDQKLDILIGSLVMAILLIAILVGLSFRNIKLFLIALLVNLIPISWFFVFYYFSNMAMSIELFIALAISVTVTSDAIIHFTYVYWRNRSYGKSKLLSLDTMFFYTGFPIIISTLILILAFVIMSISPNESLQLIGSYSLYLISLSLIVDFIILPIYILYVDGEKKQVSKL